MKKILKTKKRVLTFLALTFLLSIIPYIRIIADKTLEGNELFIFFLMWSPGIAAIATKQFYDKSQRGLGWRIGPFKYIVISYLIPLVACLIVYPMVWFLKIGGVELLRIGGTYSEALIKLFIFATVGIVGSLITATGEEIGWRGFLVPELFKNYSFTQTSLMIGIIWSIYHLPIVIFSDYNNGISILSSIVFFTTSIISISFITTWLRLKSGSLWTGAVLHASHNLFIQSIFDPITIDFGYTRVITSEFGFGLSLVYALAAFYCWKRKSDIEITTPEYSDDATADNNA